MLSTGFGAAWPRPHRLVRPTILLTRISEGHATPADLGRLERLSATVGRTSLCGLGQAAPNPVLSTLRHFRQEYLTHIHDRECPAGVCPLRIREAVP